MLILEIGDNLSKTMGFTIAMVAAMVIIKAYFDWQSLS